MDLMFPVTLGQSQNIIMIKRKLLSDLNAHLSQKDFYNCLL